MGQTKLKRKKKPTYALKTPRVVAPTFVYAIEYALVPDRRKASFICLICFLSYVLASS